MLLNDFPPRSAVCEWFVTGREDGTRDRTHARLGGMARARCGHDPGPPAAVLGAVSVPNAGPAEQIGYDTVKKKIRVPKRHIIADSLGLFIGVLVAADTAGIVGDVHRFLSTVLVRAPDERRDAPTESQLAERYGLLASGA